MWWNKNNEICINNEHYQAVAAFRKYGFQIQLAANELKIPTNKLGKLVSEFLSNKQIKLKQRENE